MSAIRIVVADDHEVVRKGLMLVLRQEPDFEIVGEAHNGREAVALSAQRAPDLALLDWKMPEMDGLAAAAIIRQQSPEVRTLILSGAPIEAAALDALDAGVDGFVHKDTSPADLAQAIRIVAGGKKFLGPEIKQALTERAQTAAAPKVSLSPREMDVLQLMATAATYREIGEQLYIGEETVRSHAKSILVKLDQPNRTQAVITAIRAGLISLD
ncbi:MAG: response regulator transcription factor [Chloroflexota bacterium]|nr:MAG: response regulator transcription factor [Chloroflexota bacterium]